MIRIQTGILNKEQGILNVEVSDIKFLHADQSEAIGNQTLHYLTFLVPCSIFCI
jgi:hypothetical protein